MQMINNDDIPKKPEIHFLLMIGMNPSNESAYTLHPNMLSNKLQKWLQKHLA